MRNFTEFLHIYWNSYMLTLTSLVCIACYLYNPKLVIMLKFILLDVVLKLVSEPDSMKHTGSY